MAKRTDFAQKLLNDLRLRKERMGLAAPKKMPPLIAPVANSYTNSRQSFHSSGAAATATNNYVSLSGTKLSSNSNINRPPSLGGCSQELVPFGRNGSQQAIDLSMALALALGNGGKLRNIEIIGNPAMGRKIVLHMDGAPKSPHAYPFPSQIGAVAKGAQNLNLILKACSNGFNFGADSIRIGRELLKGAMDLEESLKMLATLQDASDFMAGSQWKKSQPKLLKGEEEEEEESKTYSGNRQRAGRRSKFSFIRESSSTSDYKSNRSSAKSTGFSSGGVCSVSKQNQVSSKANLTPNKVRIPNVIAKLMGLEELSALREAKSSEKQKASRSLQLKEISNRLVKEDEDFNEREASMISEKFSREKLKNEMAKNIKSSRISDSGSLRVGKKYATEGREENAQQAKEKIETVESGVRMMASDFEQKITLPIPDAKHENNSRKKETSSIKEPLETISFSQSHDERNRKQVHQFVHSSQYGEGIKEARVEKLADAKVKSQSSVANKLATKSNDRESHPYEIRTIKESHNSNQKKLVNKTAGEMPKGNLKTSSNDEKEYMKNKSNQNHCGGKELTKKEAREKMARTAVQLIVMRKPVNNHSVKKLCDLKVRDGEVPVQNIAGQSMEQRSSIFEELECRWKERNKQVEETEKGAAATIKLDLQKEIQTITSVNSPDEENMRIKNCNPTKGEEPRTATSSNLVTRCGNNQASTNQRIQEEINVKIERGNSASQLQERTCITATECIKCSEEDSRDKFQEKQSKFTESREGSDPSMQLNGSKYAALQNLKVKEADQQLLTEHEDAIKQIFISSQNFRIIAQTLFQISIPADIFQANKNGNLDKDSKLVIDCGKELLRRKGQREEASFCNKWFLAPLKKRSINTLIKEVNVDLESLKCRNSIEGCESDLADCLNKMIESDIQQRNPDINCLWDFGWDNRSFVCLEKYEIVKDVGKYMLNGLLNELATDLLDVSISSV